MAEVLTHNQTFDRPQDALAHYGVKGMKWGVRKKEAPNDEPNPRYSSSLRSRDRSSFGKKGVRNINRKLNQGVSRKEAVQAERWRMRRNTALIAVGYLAAATVLNNRDVLAYSISSRAETNRGRAAAANVFGLPAPGADGGIRRARSRRGAYQVTGI